MSLILSIFGAIRGSDNKVLSFQEQSRKAALKSPDDIEIAIGYIFNGNYDEGRCVLYPLVDN
ncbi:MAG: hypothetical protein ACI9WC_001232 [Arenicella sp.]